MARRRNANGAAALDPDDLRFALGKLTKDRLLAVLDAALAAIPRSRVNEVLGVHIDLGALRSRAATRRPGAPARLLADAKKFHAGTMAGLFYEGFRVNSKNFMDKSETTEEWIYECNQLFGRCVDVGAGGNHVAVRDALELLLDLLRRINRGEKIIFFADKGGDWQVGVEWDRVLPAYFASLVATETAERFTTQALDVVGEFVRRDEKKFLGLAKKAVFSKAPGVRGPIITEHLVGLLGLGRAPAQALLAAQPRTVLEALRIHGVGRKTTRRLLDLGLLGDPEGVQHRSRTDEEMGLVDAG
jgi:hypothetical protein